MRWQRSSPAHAPVDEHRVIVDDDAHARAIASLEEEVAALPADRRRVGVLERGADDQGTCPRPDPTSTPPAATSTKLVVTIPPKVATLLAAEDGSSAPTLLRLRVIGARMGRAWTQNSRSPLC